MFKYLFLILLTVSQSFGYTTAITPFGANYIFTGNGTADGGDTVLGFNSEGWGGATPHVANSFNVSIGNSAFSTIGAGQRNTCIGTASCSTMVDDSDNIGIGYLSDPGL